MRRNSSPLALDVQPSSGLNLVAPQHGASWEAVAPASGPTWGLETLGIPDLWGERLSGKVIVVGHIDDCIDVTHPEIWPAVPAA